MLLASLRHERKSAVALLFAISAIPIVGLTGLAIDYGIWNQTYASISLAASSAALNAVKIANAANLNNDPNAQTEGQNAGKQWFISQVGPNDNAAHFQSIRTDQVKVAVTVAATTKATVTYTDTVPPIFGNLFGVADYPLTVTAKAEIIASPYLNVEILLDNSPSMEIGATPGDIAAMQYLTPCASTALWGGSVSYTGGIGTAATFNTNGANQAYDAYSCGSGVTSYTGTLACPITATSFPLPATWTSLQTSGYVQGPSCAGLTTPTETTKVPTVAQWTALSVPQPEFAGAPCAFACHFDTAHQPGNDYYGLARSTLNQPTECYNLGSMPTAAQLAKCAITLRFDLVKNAVIQTINAMEADNLAINNLNVGVFTLDATLHQWYPNPNTCGTTGSLACQAGNQWSTALADVGAPPTAPNTADTGILPYDGGDAPSTNFPLAMCTLLGLSNVSNPPCTSTSQSDLTSSSPAVLTAAGDGSSATSPLKVLFLVTDGMADYVNNGTRLNVAIDPTLCQNFKNEGYAVYVVYTPYYPLMNNFYLTTNKTIAEGTGSTSLQYNLQACATSPEDYIEANPNDSTSINTALQGFLKRALAAAARFTE